MIPISEWATNITRYVPNIPYPGIILNVRDACRKFCAESWIWQDPLEKIDVIEEQPDYELVPPEGAEIVAVPDYGVRYKNPEDDEDRFFKLKCVSENDLNRIYTPWKYLQPDTPRMFYIDFTTKRIHLHPRPKIDSPEGLEVVAVLKPTKTATEVPNMLYADYEDAITYGALSYIFNDRAMDWFSPELARDYELRFRTEYVNARDKIYTGATNKDTSRMTAGYWA